MSSRFIGDPLWQRLSKGPDETPRRCLRRGRRNHSATRNSATAAGQYQWLLRSNRVVGDQRDRADHRQPQEHETGDQQPVGRFDDVGPFALVKAQPVGGGRGDEAGRGGGGGDQRRVEQVPLEQGRLLEALRERHGEQEREQDLHAGERDPQLLQELGHLAIALDRLLAAVVVCQRTLPRLRGRCPHVRVDQRDDAIGHQPDHDQQDRRPQAERAQQREVWQGDSISRCS